MVDPEPVQPPSPPKTPKSEPPSTPSGGDSNANVLQERLGQYQLAISKTTGAKQKRYQRQLKQIERQIQTVKKGGNVTLDDIPSQPAGIGINPAPPTPAENPSDAPAVPVRAPPTPTSPPVRKPVPPIPPRAAEIPISALGLEESDLGAAKAAESKFKLDLMSARLGDYKTAALTAKKEGDKANAVRFFTQMKALQAAIDAQNIDFDVPPKPTKSTSPKPPPAAAKPAPVQPAEPPPAPQPAAMAPPKTLLEGMEQRRKIFLESEQKAAKEGNGSKARRLGRQRKQYDDVIKKLKAGQHPDISHLTVPPNCPPLPGESGQPMSFEETLQKATSVANRDPDEADTSPVKSPPKPAMKSPSKPPTQEPIDAVFRRVGTCVENLTPFNLNYFFE